MNENPRARALLDGYIVESSRLGEIHRRRVDPGTRPGLASDIHIYTHAILKRYDSDIEREKLSKLVRCVWTRQLSDHCLSLHARH